MRALKLIDGTFNYPVLADSALLRHFHSSQYGDYNRLMFVSVRPVRVSIRVGFFVVALRGEIDVRTSFAGCLHDLPSRHF